MHSKPTSVLLQLLVIHVVVTIRPMLNNVFNNLYSILCFDYKVWNGRMKKTRKSGKKNELKIRNRWGGQSLMGIIQLDGESVIFRTRRGRVVWIESPPPMGLCWRTDCVGLCTTRMMDDHRTDDTRKSRWVDGLRDGWMEEESEQCLDKWIYG